jgi:hypothetical protein
MRSLEYQRQASALSYARQWAKVGEWKRFKKRVQEAMQYWPLSEMQIYNLQLVAGRDKTLEALSLGRKGVQP